MAAALPRLLVARPVRRAVDRPYPYSCHPRLVRGRELDASTLRFGIRSLTVDAERGLRINGEAVTPRGA